MVAQEIMKWVKEWVAGWSTRQFFSRSSHQLTSRGAASSGYPLVLGKTGEIDISFFDATGDARYGRLGSANTWSAAQTFSSGIVLGNETLTVYDEGTWTPTLRFGTGTTGITYTTRTGVYTRIGNRVFIHCLITLSSKGSSTGNADISGLPFTVGNSSPYPARWLTMVTSFIGMFVIPSAGGTTIAIRALTAASTDGGVAITDTAFNNTSTLNFEANYKI